LRIAGQKYFRIIGYPKFSGNRKVSNRVSKSHKVCIALFYRILQANKLTVICIYKMGLQYDNFVFCLKTGNNKAVKFKKSRQNQH
jgi:hypothetical protein